MKERYALVKFRPKTMPYTYKCDENVKKGNIVLVPVSGYPEPKEVIVYKIKYLKDSHLPVSKDKIKSVLSVVSESDVENKFTENLNIRYYFEKDGQVDNNWVESREDSGFDVEGLPYKKTFTHKNGKAVLSLFSKGKFSIILCDIGNINDFYDCEEISCSSKQEMKYVLNRLKIAVNNFLTDKEKYNEEYLLNIFKYPNDRNEYLWF